MFFRVFAIVVLICVVSGVCYGQGAVTVSNIKCSSELFDPILPNLWEVTITGTVHAHKDVHSIFIQGVVDGKEIIGLLDAFAELSAGESEDFELESIVFDGKPVRCEVKWKYKVAPPPPAKFVKVSGDTQSGTPGTRLAKPFVVEVQDKDDNPMEGISVTFRVTDGGGTLSATTVATGANGRAQTFLTLGRTRAVNRVQASVSGINTPVTFSTSIEATVLIAAANRPPMYWVSADTGTLHRLIGAKVENLLPSVQNATSLAIGGGKLYWTTTDTTNPRRGTLNSANLDGNTGATELAAIYGAPLQIAIDAGAAKLYWTDVLGRIQQADLNAQNIRNVIRDLPNPTKVDLAVSGDKLYWTTTDTTNPRRGTLNSANLDGDTGATELAAIYGAPLQIAVDAEARKLYWTDVLGRIQQANLNAQHIRNVIRDREGLKHLTLDVAAGKVYWTQQGSLWRADLTGENVETVVRGLGTIGGFVLGTMPMDASAPAAPAAVASPQQNALLANYPNPFNPETWIPYQLSKPADVRVHIYAVNGRLVRTLTLGHQPAGVYQSRSRAAYWDGKNAFGEPVASGLYFYTLTAGDFTATRKMLIRK